MMHKVERVEDSTGYINNPDKQTSLLKWIRDDGARIFLPWGVGGVLFVLALGLDCYRLGDPSIWFDEAFSVELARQPLPLLWHIIFGPEPNMELYYLFLHFWLGFTGVLGFNPTEVVVRLPSVVFAALSTLVVFAFGRRFIGMLAGTLGAVLYLLNYLELVYAQQTRSYALQLLLICLAWYALIAALTDEKQARSWWIVYVVAMALAIYAQLFSLIIVIAQLVAVVGMWLMAGAWQDRVRERLVAFGLSLVATGVLVIPMLLESLHGAKTDWLPVPHLHDLLQIFMTMSGDAPGRVTRLYLLAIGICCCLGVLVALLAYCLEHVPSLRRVTPGKGGMVGRWVAYQRLLPVAWAMLCWLVIPIILSYVISQGSLRLFSTRYLVTVVPPLFLLVGIGVETLSWRVVQAACLCALVVLALPGVSQYYKSAQVEDWNSTSHWLIQQYQNGDGLVCYDNEITQGCQISVEYYLHAYPSEAHFTSDSPGAFSWENYGPADPATGFTAALDQKVLAAYAKKHRRIFFIVGRVPTDQAAAQVVATQNWLDSHYRFADQIVTRTVTIRLYVTGGGNGT